VAGAPSAGVEVERKAGVVVSVSDAFFAIADFFMAAFFAVFFIAFFDLDAVATERFFAAPRFAALFLAAVARTEAAFLATAIRFAAMVFVRVARTVAAFFASAERLALTDAARLVVASFALAGLTAAFSVVRVGSAEALLILNTTVGSASAPISEAAIIPRRMRVRLIF